MGETFLMLFVFQLVDASRKPSIECLKFCDSNEPWLAVGTSSGHFAIYDYAKSVVRHVLKDKGYSFTVCCWHRSSANLICVVAGNADGVLRIWDARSGQPYIVSAYK